MPFDKEPIEKAGVSPYRVQGSWGQRNAQFQAHKKEEFFATRGGGGGRRFSDVYRLPLEDLDIIRLVPGEYVYTGGRKDGSLYEIQLEYWTYSSHYFAKKVQADSRSIICSGGPFYYIDAKAEPCLGCSEVKKGADNVGRSEKYAFSLIHFAPYHKVASTDDKGNVRKNPQTGDVYFDWVRCRGRNKCEDCKDAIETRPFNRMHWSMPYNHYKTLTVEYDPLIGKSCVNCRGRDTIDWDAWVCANCGEAIFERQTTQMDAAEIRKIVNGEVVCPHCKGSGLLNEVVSCRGCSDPRRATIFDVDMHVKAMETNKKNQTQLIVGSWSEPHPLDPAVPEELRKPLDLPRIYRPDKVEKQAEYLGIKLEGGKALSQETQAYGGESPNFK